MAFSLIASAVYLLNDMSDREFDRKRPEKRSRPIASGTLSIRAATLAGLVLTASSFTLAAALGAKVISVLALDVLVNIAYSAGLRKEPVLDVLLIAFGFVLRPMAGAYAIPVYVSSWLFVVSLFLSLSLALMKRRAELVAFQELAISHRPALSEYSVRFLDQLVAIVTGAAIISYASSRSRRYIAKRWSFPCPRSSIAFSDIFTSFTNQDSERARKRLFCRIAGYRLPV